MFLTGVAMEPVLRMSIAVNSRGDDDCDMEEVSTTCKLGWACVGVGVGTFFDCGLLFVRPYLLCCHGRLAGVTMGVGVVVVPADWSINPVCAGANSGVTDGP